MKTFRSFTGAKKANLSFASQHYGIKLKNAHSAISDVIATKDLLLILKTKYPIEAVCVDEESAFIKSCKKLSSSNIFTNSKNILCKFPDSKDVNKDANCDKETLLNCFKKGLSPFEASMYYMTSLSYVMKTYMDWINCLNYSFMYHHFSDRQAVVFASNILKFSKNMRKAKDIHSKIFGVDNFNYFFYFTIYKEVNY